MTLSLGRYNKHEAQVSEFIGSVGQERCVLACELYLTTFFKVLNPDGPEKSGLNQIYNVAGPLCFAGGYLARNIELLKIMRETGY